MITLALLPLLSGCALFQSQIEVSRRYDRIENETISCDSAAGAPSNKIYCFQAYVSTSPAPSPDSGLSVTGLSDRGQAAFIAGVAGKSKDAASLRAAVAGSLKTSATTSDFVDQSTQKLRFVVGQFPENGYLNPSDRLVWSKMTIRLRRADVAATKGDTTKAGNRIFFTDWTQATNSVTSIDVGSVTAERTDKLTGTTGLAIAKFATDTTVGGELDATRTETAAIKDQTSINATLHNGEAIIVQSGGWRHDLTGNATFDASIAFEPEDTHDIVFANFSDLDKGDPQHPWTPPVKLLFSPMTVRVPDSSVLCADISLDFVIRHVVQGHRTFTESDDAVEFKRGLTTNDRAVSLPLIKDRWAILRISSGERLQYEEPSGNQTLYFQSRADALAFIGWLKQAKPRGGKIGGGGTLYFSSKGDLDKAGNIDTINTNAQQIWDTASTVCDAS